MCIITGKTIMFLRRGFTMGEKFRFHPYTWNAEKKYPEVVSSAIQLSLWYAHVMTVFSYYGFLWWRCVMVNMSQETKSSQKIYMQFVLTLYTVPIIVQTTMIFRREDFAHFIKNYLEFAEVFQERFVLTDESRPGALAKLCEYFITGCFYAFSLDGILLALASALRPRSPELLSSLLENPLIISWQSGLSVAFQCYYLYGEVATVCMASSVGFAFVFTGLEIIKEFGLKKSCLTCPRLQDPKNTFSMYRCVEIEVREGIQVFSILLVGAKVLLMLFAIFCTYGAIRFHGILGIALGVVGTSTTIFLGVMMSTFAEYNSRSVRVLQKLKEKAIDPNFFASCGWRPSVYNKSLKAVPPLKVQIASMYFIDKALVLMLLKIITENIVNFLLLHS